MDRRMEVEMTPRLIAWTVFYQTRAFLFIPAIMLIALVGGAVMQARFGIPFQWDTLIMPMIFIGFFIWVPIGAYRKSMSNIRKMKTPFIRYHFTDAGLDIDTDLSSGQNKWEVFKGLQTHGKVWRIVTRNGLSFVLPVEQLDDELRAFLSLKLPSLTKAFWKRSLITFAFWALLIVILYFYFHHPHHP